uniref:AAA+ ATPase domain-containing protein n=1 Tax=Arcella intermedia TaxID=1963864 RepID=A0A6B2LAN8_9EUKA
MKKSLETGNLPHLLFYGPPGTGKTSTILAIAHQLYGEDVAERVLELNASDERGIDIIRNKVKRFSSLAVSKDPPYKLIILDEADMLTTDAQNALRRTMEHFSKVTRFCIICNYISRIIEPLTSRCAKFRFKSLGLSNIETRLEHISQQENISITPPVISAIAKQSGGDMRKAITLLQSAHRLYGEEMSLEAVYVVSGVVPEEEIVELIEICKSNSFPRLQLNVNKLVLDGYSAAQVLEQLHDLIVNDDFITSLQKANIILHISNADRCLLEGADEFLQLLNVFTQSMKILCENK